MFIIVITTSCLDTVMYTFGILGIIFIFHNGSNTKISDSSKVNLMKGDYLCEPLFLRSMCKVQQA